MSDRLGIREAQERMLDQLDATRSQRQARFVAAVRRPPPRRPALWLGAAASVAIAAVLLVLFIGRAPPKDVIELASLRGTTVEALHGPTSMSFSNGSTLDLAQGTRVHFDPERTGIRLESGQLRLDSSAAWRVDAGAFEVSTAQGAVDVRWDDDELVVATARGEANVVDAVVGSTYTVVAGETLRLQKTPKVEVTRYAADPEPVDTAPIPQEDRRAIAKSPQRGPSWEQLAKAKKYKEALAAAERAGFEQQCRRAPANSLLALGDAARYSGEPHKAATAFEAVRRRFPKTAHAARAAYSLGRLAFDSRRDFADASKWFDTYLRERPAGGLAREALGRLMESQKRSGATGKAEATARRYLDKYPTGPHADIARGLTGMR